MEWISSVEVHLSSALEGILDDGTSDFTES